MKKEQLIRANKLIDQINDCERNIERANYTQSENVQIRETLLRVNGLDADIEIPETLFRVIGKLILSEYNQKLIELKKEFDEL